MEQPFSLNQGHSHKHGLRVTGYSPRVWRKAQAYAPREEADTSPNTAMSNAPPASALSPFAHMDCMKKPATRLLLEGRLPAFRQRCTQLKLRPKCRPDPD